MRHWKSFTQERILNGVYFMEPTYKKHLRFSLALIAAVIFAGVSGYIILENYNLIDAVYMTVITIATVGFQEVHPLTKSGKIFTIFLTISSFGIFAYAITSISTY